MKNYGFDPKLLKIKPEDYKYGSSIPLKVLKHDGQLEDYLPEYEAQADKYETSGCTVYGGQNQLEGQLKLQFDVHFNAAERFNYNIVGIEHPGANPHDVYESFRRDGIIPQEDLPIPETYEEFKSPRPMSEELLKKGKKWLETYTLVHEWIIPSHPMKMKELIKSALSYGFVGLSVTAWYQDEDGYYVDRGQQNNHWCVCYGWREAPEGLVLKIFDSYDHSKKELHPDHFVMAAKRIYIEKSEPIKVKGFWQRLFEIFFREKLIFRDFKIYWINYFNNKKS